MRGVNVNNTPTWIVDEGRMLNEQRGDCEYVLGNTNKQTAERLENAVRGKVENRYRLKVREGMVVYMEN